MKRKKQNFHHKDTNKLRIVDCGLRIFFNPKSEIRNPKFSLCALVSLWLVLIFLFAGVTFASDFDNAKQMIMSGQVEAGAQMLAKVVKSNPSPEALFLMCQACDRMQDLFSERVEKKCYWGRGSAGTPECAQREAEALNSIYGAGAYKFVTDIAYVPYSGIHCQEVINKYPGSQEAKEAKFQMLLKDLVGHPSVVIPKVKVFLDKNSGGDIGRKALLLWARVNEDVWHIHRSWSWVIYNQTISPDELIVKAEPYRQEALKAYEKLIGKYPGTFEAGQAQRELDLLKSNQDDGETYSILADTVGGSPDKWGNPIPKPALTATQRGVGDPGWKQTAPPGLPPPVPTPTLPEPAQKKKGIPQRWK